MGEASQGVEAWSDFSIVQNHKYPEDWKWWVCTREYAGVEFDGCGLQRVDYLPMCKGDLVATLPSLQLDGSVGLQEAAAGDCATKYPFYYYVHSFHGAGWVPTMLLKSCAAPNVRAADISHHVFEPSHLSRTPAWFQCQVKSVTEYIITYGQKSPVWALRESPCGSSVEAKLEHYLSPLGLVVTDLSGHQVVTYYPPDMRRSGGKVPSHRQRIAGQTQFSITDEDKRIIKENFARVAQWKGISAHAHNLSVMPSYESRDDPSQKDPMSSSCSSEPGKHPTHFLALHPAYDW